MVEEINFNNLVFGARELRVPLFRLDDPKHLIYKRDTIIFYKDNLIHIYFFKKRAENARLEGRRFFGKPAKLNDYQRKSLAIKKLAESKKIEYQSLNIKELLDNDLNVRFKEIINLLNLYSNHYLLTEPMYLNGLEETKNGPALLRQIGRLRLSLKQVGKILYPILLGKILPAIAKKYKISTTELFFYSKKEIDRLLKNGEKVPYSIIKTRKNGYVLIQTGARKKLLVGKEFNKIFLLVVRKGRKRRMVKHFEIRGQCAMKGFVRGVARVIKHAKPNIWKELMKLKNTEILVTDMLKPDESILITQKRIAAIVTDEGGLASHVAIIAREFGVPCVMGTETATQQIKDGAYIEVDAAAGIVRSVDKSK